MYRPSAEPDSIDDKDTMGVFVGPIEHYLGFGRKDVYERFVGEWDTVCYEVRKFIGLLLNCNPNVMSLLWLPEKHIIYQSIIGKILCEERETFVSAAAYKSFTGYAHGQLKRMTHFNKEMQEEITRLEDIIGAEGIDVDKLNATQPQRDKIGDEIKQYEQLKAKYFSGGYMGRKRKELVMKFGYDCKNAAHLIRLLKMGIEFLGQGVLYVDRSNIDAEELLQIKRGEWPLERVTEEAERLFKLAEKEYSLSPLPEAPDREAAERLCRHIIGFYHNLRVEKWANFQKAMTVLIQQGTERTEVESNERAKRKETERKGSDTDPVPQRDM